jgi:aspartyl-tRNA(Asn)/glutamyl-tRNA(Gln) amidotransferase subunit A
MKQLLAKQKRTIKDYARSIQADSKQIAEVNREYAEEITKNNSQLNAYIYIDDQKLTEQIETAENKYKAIAGKSVEEMTAQELLTALPISLKDNFNWIDTPTTASSNILKNYISPYNATVTQRLIDAGVVINGKTNMDAFAHGSSTETSDFGPTLNPYDLERVPGGSSGGSAVSVAAGMALLSIGSETAGSVRGPAAWCGLYGFAPTYGRFSRYGVVAMGSSLDRPGVLTNSTEDCAIIADVLSGVDPEDATTIPEGSTNYYRNLNANYTNLKIGIPKQFLDERINKEVAERSMEIAKAYEKLGAELIEIDLLDPKYSMAVYTIICRSEVSSNLARIDGIRYGHYSEEIVNDVLGQIALNRWEGFGNEAKQRSMTGAYTLSAGYYDAYYKKAQKVRTLIIEDFKTAFSKVDLIMGPTMPEVAPHLGVTANNPLFGELADILTEPSALAGLPCISVPAGLDKAGLPIGVQIIGPQFSEQKVLDAAFTIEKNISN